MRPIKTVAVAAVAFATTLGLLPVTPVASAQTETNVNAESDWNAVERPPAFEKGGAVWVLMNGVYVRVDKIPDLPVPPPDRGEEDPQKPEPGSNSKPDGSSTTTAGNVIAWVAPLLIIAGAVAAAAAVFRHQFPTGRLMVYFQPGDHLGNH